MQVKVKHRLPGAAAVVEDRAVAIGQLSFAGKLCGKQLQAPEHRAIFRARVGERNQVFPRTDQDMRGRLRVNVFKRE